jgi:hypothetical protein
MSESEGELFGDIAENIGRITRTAQRLDSIDGLAYTNLGLGIKCVTDAWVKAHGESITRDVPVRCTTAWLLMRKAIVEIETLLCTTEVDFDLPCYTEVGGSNPYYTPLQYCCLLNKILLPGSWTSDMVMKLSLRGASHELPDFWTPAMKYHANLLLARRSPAAQQSGGGPSTS